MERPEAERPRPAETSGPRPAERIDPERADPDGVDPPAAGGDPVAGRGWRRHAAWLLANLVVVFLGVYSAFLLDRLREDRRDRARLHAFERALLQEFASNADYLAAGRDDLVASFSGPLLEALDAGQRPRLQPLPFAVGELDTGTWRAMMTAGGLELLDPATIIEIDGFYATLGQIVRDLERFERLSDRYLIPVIEADASTFYDREGKLRLSWRWYEETLRRLPDRLEGVAGWARSIADRLEARAGSLPASGAASRGRGR